MWDPYGHAPWDKWNPVSELIDDAVDGISDGAGWAWKHKHGIIEVGGYVPGVGDLADAADVVAYGFEGDWGNAGLSLIAVVPFAGSPIKSGLKHGDEVIGGGTDVVRHSDDVAEAGTDAASHSSRKAAEEVKTPKQVEPAKPKAKESAGSGGSTKTTSHPSNSSGGGKSPTQAKSNSCPVGGGFHSFSGDTPVLMADGSLKPIAQIEVGDKVLATDPVTGVQSAEVVTHLWVHKDTLTDLVLANGHALTTTEDHPFWNATDEVFEDAGAIDAGEAVITDQWNRIDVVGLDPGTAHTGWAYNLTVDDLHTYHVGNDKILVHNCGGAEAGHSSKCTCADGGGVVDLPSQTHHYATNKNTAYAPAMQKIADRFGLDLDGEWNKEMLAHQGRHPNEYHDFVLGGMREAASIAGTDTNTFLNMFDVLVKVPVRQNPLLLRKAGWE